MDRFGDRTVRVVVLSFFTSLSVFAAAELPLSKAIEIRRLSTEAAEQGRLVRIQGTVTFASPHGSTFVQDETAATFFPTGTAEPVRPGDVVEVIGRTYMGFYLAGIRYAQCRILSHGLLPVAIPADYEELNSGRYHYQRVAIEGIVRSLMREGDRSRLRVALGGRIVDILVEAASPHEAIPIDSRVRVIGLAVGIINSRRQLVQPYLRLQDWTGVEVLDRGVPAGQVPQVSGADLLTFRVDGQGFNRVRINGLVTGALPGGQVFLRDGATALAVRFSQPVVVAVGDRVTVLGFPLLDRVSPTLVDAELAYRRPDDSPRPVKLEIVDLLRGFHDCDLVEVTGVITDSFRTEGTMGMTVQNLARTASATVRSSGPVVPIGSVVRAVGICRVDSTVTAVYNSRPESVSLLVRQPDDLVVVQSPSPWTVRRLSMILGVLAVLVLVSALWIFFLRRRVKQQTVSLRLSIESEAALQERQRIAREFHDTLEQELAAVCLRLDAAATRADDDKAQSLIAASRSLVTRIQSEARNLISDLRGPAEIAGDLATVLEELVQRISERSDVPVEFDVKQRPQRLASTTVHQLRMVTAECVANALKHSGATAITITLEKMEDQVLIKVTDNGRGFDCTTATWGSAGHFGCIGIRERCRNIGAEVEWTSHPGQGTMVTIDLFLNSRPGAAGAAPKLLGAST